jgi:hypothetical protein
VGRSWSGGEYQHHRSRQACTLLARGPDRYGCLVFAARAMARGLQRSSGALAGLGLVLAMGIGVAGGSLEAAMGTQNAYPFYLQRAGVGEVVVNPGITPLTGPVTSSDRRPASAGT